MDGNGFIGNGLKGLIKMINQDGNENEGMKVEDKWFGRGEGRRIGHEVSPHALMKDTLENFSKALRDATKGQPMAVDESIALEDIVVQNQKLIKYSPSSNTFYLQPNWNKKC